MLMLARKLGQEILIGKNGEIKICVLSISKRKIIIGVEAASNVPVHRREIFERIKTNNDDVTSGAKLKNTH